MSTNYEKAKKAISGLVNTMVATNTVFNDTPQRGSNQSSKAATATQTNASAATAQKSFSSGDDYIQRRMAALKANSRIGASGVSKWFEDAYGAMEEMQSYNKANASKYDANYGGEAGERIKSLLNSSKDVYDYIYNHADEFENADELKKMLSQYRSNLISFDKGNYDTRQYYSQFGSEEGYNNHLKAVEYGNKSAEEIEAEQKVLDDAYGGELAFDIRQAESDLAAVKSNASHEAEYSAQEAHLKTLKEQFKKQYGFDYDYDAYALGNPVLYYDQNGAVTMDNLITVKKTEGKLAAIQSDPTLNSAYNELMTYEADVAQMEHASSYANLLFEGYSDAWIKQNYPEYKEAYDYIVSKYGNEYSIESRGQDPTALRDALYTLIQEVGGGHYSGQKAAKDILSQGGYDWDEINYYRRWERDRERDLERRKSYKLAAEQYPVLTTVGNLFMGPAMAIEFLGDVAERALYAGKGDYTAYKLDNIYDNSANAFSETVSGTVTENIRNDVLDKTGSEFWSGLAGTAYSGVTSAVQSYVTQAMFGGVAGSLILASQAASSAYAEGIRNGQTTKQAMAVGVISGVAEYFTEKITWDKLLEIDTSWDTASTRTFLKSLFNNSSNVFVQGLYEGGEEVISTLANTIADELIAQDKSSIATAIRQYKMAGLSDTDAEKQATQDWWTELLDSAIGGFIGGAAGGGAVTTFQTGIAAADVIGNNIRENRAYKTLYGQDLSALIDEALEVDPSNKLAKKIKEQLNSGKNVSGSQIKSLVRSNEAGKVKSDIASIKETAKQRLADLGETMDIDAVSSALAKQAAGEKLTKAEQKAIDNSKYGQRVANELNVENIQSGQYSSEWAQKIGTERINADEYSRLVADAQSNPENIDSTPTINAAENANNEAEKASFPVNVLADNSPEGVMAAMAAQQQTEDQPGKSTLTVENVAEKSAAPAALYKSIYNLSPTQDVAKFDDGFRKAYEWGLTGVVPVEYALKSNLTDPLTNKQVELAYQAGADAKNALAENRGARMQSGTAFRKPSAASIKNGRKVGTVKLGDGVKASDLNPQQKRGTRMLRFIAEATGKDIILVKSEVGPDGKYRLPGKEDYQGKFSWGEDVIRIDINAGLLFGVDALNDASYTMLRTFTHEFVHTIERDNATGYNELREVVFAELRARGKNVEALIHEKQGVDEDGNPILSYDAASREVVAEALSDILRDSKFIDKLVNKHQNLAEYLLEKLKEFVNNIREYFETIKSNPNPDAAARALQDDIDGALRYAENIIEVFDRVALQSVENYQAAAVAKVAQTKEMLAEAGIGLDVENHEAYALRHSTAYTDVIKVGKKDFDVEGIAKAVAKGTGRSYEDALKWVNSEMAIANIIMGNPEFLDFEPDNRYEAIKKNSDYPQGTVDLSNNCPKRTEFTAMFDMLQKKYPNKLFTANDVAAMRNILKEHGITVACGACFVEDRRQLLGEIADTYIGMWKEAVETGKPLQKTNAAGNKVTLNVTKALAKQYGLTAGSQILATDKYIPTQYDLTTYEGFKLLEKNHPTVALGFIRYNNSRGQQAGRLIEGRAEYNRQILGWSEAKVRNVNNNGGLRIFSFSDFEVVHLLDLVQIIIDCAAMGVKIQGYTKIPAFSRLIRDTGIKINRSLIPKGQTGLKMVDGKQVLDYDTTEGIDINDENFLDEADNPNVGNIIIGINPTQIGIAMLDDFIDYIIPFHTNKSKEICQKLGLAEWVNYKESQHEKDIATGKASKHNVNIYTQVINKYHPTNKVEFVNAFLKECKRQGKIPRYSEFLNVDENGDFTYREGYHKLLVDFKMFDKDGNILPQGEITPNLDDAFMADLLTAEVDKKQSYEFPQEVYDQIEKQFGENSQQGIDSADADIIQLQARNNTKDIGEDNNGSTDTELLEGRKVSASDRGGNSLREQGTNSEKLAGYLGVLGKAQRQSDTTYRAGESGWLVQQNKQKIEGSRGEEGLFRAVSRIALSGKDTAGRTIGAEISEKFKDTVFKDVNGNLLSLYHWTPEAFDRFSRGEFGFHFGTLTSAHERYLQKLDDNHDTPKGNYKEVYLNITNPLYIGIDAGQWSACDIAIQLVEKGIISELQYDRLAITEGFLDATYDNPAAEAVRDILAQNKYDGIVYKNESEDAGSYSVIALYPDQIITVAENGILKEGSGVTETAENVEQYQSRDYLSADQQKHFDYNQKQTAVGSTLRTLKGSAIKRSAKHGVGKEIGGEIYFHKAYAEDVVPDEVLSQAEHLLEENYPGFEYNCLKYNPNTGVVAFQEAPDFDTAREPIVGDYVSVNTDTGVVKKGHSNYIWHHKWNWVRNDYSGFDVAESWIWSKRWLSTLTEVSDGNGIERWNAQLDRFGLPKDGEAEDRVVQYQLREVPPVRPTSSDWRPAHNESWFAENGFPLYRNVSEEQRTANEQHEMDKRAGGHGTQNKSTLPTYRKIFDYIKARGDNPRILDASSGLGAGTELGKSYDLNIHDIEPFPNAGYAPEWTDYEGLQDLVKSGAEKPFDVIISNAVLNVLAQDSRDNLIAAMDSLLRPGGQMFINVIGKDYSGAVNASPEIQRNAKGVPVGTVLTQEGENGAGREVFVWQSNSVQKVFSPQELKSYLSDALGDGYIIETPAKAWKGSGLSGTMVVVTKPSGTEQYQERTRSISDRALLQMAAGEIDIEGLTDAEKGALEIFKSRLDKLQALQQKRAEAGKLFHEQTFGENKNKSEATKTRNRMKVLDAQIEKANNEVLDVEEKSVLRDVLKKARGIVETQEKEAAEAKIKRMRDRHDHATERRDMKARIRRTVMALDKVLNRGNKKQNVKEGMKDLVTDALKLVDILFTDDYNDTDMIRNGVGTELTDKEAKQMAEAKTLLAEMEAVQAKLNVTSDPVAMLPMQEKLEDLKKKMDYRRSLLRDVFTRERTRLNSIPADEIIGKLADEYKKLQDSEHGYIAGAYQDSVYEFLTNLKKNLEHKVVRDMSTPELGAMYSAFTMVLTTVRDANKAFNEGIKETIEELGTQTMFEVNREGKNRKYGTEVGRAISSFSWNNTKPIYAFERIGSNTLTMLFNNIANGENVYAVDIEEAKAFKNAVAKKYGYTSWDFKKPYEFTSSSGMKFNLNLQQIMSIYAYSKREAAHDHLTKGGIVFSDNTKVYVNKKGIQLTYLNEDATAYNLSDALVAEIVEKYMTKEQRDFVDEMQDYLSTVVGENGNEISMKLYGVNLFGEKHYFPLRSSGAYLTKAKEAEIKKEQGQISIVNSGFTKATTPNASNPIVLDDFMSVWSDHVNEMSLYHAFVLPLEDFRRVYNYNSPNVEEGKSMSVDSAIRNAQGRAASQYIDQLLRDINGGTVADPREIGKGWVSNFKKASVIGSLSVVIQQPTAVYRAMAYVDPKHFNFAPTLIGFARSVASPVTHQHSKLWEELKTYAPGVAIIKEIGGFDTSTGQGIVDYISTSEYEKGKDNRLKAYWNDKQYRRSKNDEILGWLPAKADEMAWVSIWQAVKKETKARNKGMDVNSEEFLKLAGERFTEVIRKTQVYDSVFTKSSYMRSKNAFMAMLTSFMAEPTTTINMVQDAMRKLLKGNWKHATRVASSVAVSIIVNNLLRSIIYAMRDDDEDETFLEKYIESLVGGIRDDANPLNYYPVLRDVWSLMQGYDVERTDMTAVGKVVDVVNHMAGLLAKDTEDMDDDEIKERNDALVSAGWDLIASLASVFGWPVKNIGREVMGVFNTYGTLTSGQESTSTSAWDAAKEAFYNSLPVFMRHEMPSDREKLYNAIMKGDTVYVERLKNGYSSDESYHSALRRALREGDPRIKEAAEARLNGNFSRYKELFYAIKNEGNFTFDDIGAAIDAEFNSLQEEKDGYEAPERENKSESVFDIGDYYAAIIGGKTAEADKIKADLIAEKKGEGYLTHEAEDSIKSSFASKVKEGYMDGDINFSRASTLLAQYGGKETSEEAISEVKKWDFELEYGYSWGARARGYRLGYISKNALIAAVMDVEGAKREEAIAYVDFLDLEKSNENVDITSSDASGYFKYAEPAGISVSVYLDYKERTSGLTSDKDANGKTISESKKAKVLAVINSLPITSAQKDALYYASGYEKSTLYKAPWR